MQSLKHNLSTFLNTICFKQKAVLAFILLALLILINCGKRKPPLPPVENVQQRPAITAFQRGAKIILSWRMPNRNAADGNLQNIDRADIYRLVEPFDADYTLSEDEFAARSMVIATVPVSPEDFLKSKTFVDQLEFAGQNIRVRYAVRFVNSNGQKAAFSNFVVIEPYKSVPSAPFNLKASVSQEFINLEWNEPPDNIDKNPNVSILGYNIYRSEFENETAKLINKNPVSANEFKDEFFEFDKNYFYFVRAVTLGSRGEPLESEESNIVKVLPTDKFAPAPPEAVTIAASPGIISIFFAVNIEKDVIGYKIFRSRDPNEPMENWQQINEGLLTVNTFQDTKIESGVKYFYYLQAVDKAGNVSGNSTVVSETAP